MKLNIDKSIYGLLLINPLLSLAMDGTTIRYFYLTLPIIYILVAVRVLQSKEYKTRALIINAISILAIAIGISRGGDYGKINNHLFNYLSALMLMLYISVPKYRDRFIGYIKKHINWFVFVCIVIEAVELYMLVTRKGFALNWNWGGYYFKGTNSMPHTMAYLMLCTLFMTICIIIVKRKSFYACLAVIPAVCIMLSGVRAVLVPIGVLLLIFLDMFFSKKSKSVIFNLIKATIFAGIIFVVFYDQIMSSSMMAKIINRRNSSSITSGRTEIWIYLVKIFFSKLSNIVFGIGDQNVYYYTSIHPIYHHEIWAHSDFIQIMVGKGIPCLICYIYAFKVYIASSLKKGKRYYPILIFGSVLFLAAFNGFYNYRDLMLAIPIITASVYLLNNEWFRISGQLNHIDKKRR